MTAHAEQPHREPLRTTLVRTILIALCAGTALMVWSSRSAHPIRWAVAVAVMLWPSFGGHWVELWYLNWLRPRLPATPSVRRVARLATWFAGGCVLGVGALLTLRALDGVRIAFWPGFWLAGLVFIGVELVAHTGLQARGERSFFNGRG